MSETDCEVFLLTRKPQWDSFQQFSSVLLVVTKGITVALRAVWKKQSLDSIYLDVPKSCVSCNYHAELRMSGTEHLCSSWAQRWKSRCAPALL